MSLIIESDKEVVNASQEKTFTYLSDMSNLKKFMPPQVTQWTSTVDECSYVLNGMANISKKITERNANSSIKMESFGKVPFAFTLTFLINAISDTQTELQLVFDGDVNMFMKPMVEKPLTNFFNYLVKQASKTIN